MVSLIGIYVNACVGGYMLNATRLTEKHTTCWGDQRAGTSVPSVEKPRFVFLLHCVSKLNSLYLSVCRE